MYLPVAQWRDDGVTYVCHVTVLYCISEAKYEPSPGRDTDDLMVARQVPLFLPVYILPGSFLLPVYILPGSFH